MQKRAADDDAAGDGKRARADGKVFQLFSKLSEDKRARLQLDDEAFFSVTDQRSAERITRVILALDGVTDASRVSDGCACVGGNVLAFRAAFSRGHVRAIELDDRASQASSLLDWGPAKLDRDTRLYDGVDKWGLAEKEARRRADAEGDG